LGPPGAAGGGAKEQEVALDAVMEDEFQAQTEVGGYGIKIRIKIKIRIRIRIKIRIKEARMDGGGYGFPAQTHCLDRVEPKRRRWRWGPEEFEPPNAPEHGVELDVGLLAAERATAQKPPPDDAAVIGGQNMRLTAAELAGTVNPGRAQAAVEVPGKGGPGVALGRGQQGEPVAGESAKELADADLGRGAGVAGDEIAAGIDEVGAARVRVTDDVALLHPPEVAAGLPDGSRRTYIFHKVIGLGCRRLAEGHPPPPLGRKPSAREGAAKGRSACSEAQFSDKIHAGGRSARGILARILAR
jgi:hypothetical protein